MTNRTGFIERRKHKRLKAKEGAFAAVTSGDCKIGQIKNISKGGLAFQYIDNGEPSSGSVEIEIFSVTEDFYLKKSSAKVVRDSEVDSTVPLSSLPVREVVVQFGKMESNQMYILNCFLHKYTANR